MSPRKPSPFGTVIIINFNLLPIYMSSAAPCCNFFRETKQTQNNNKAMTKFKSWFPFNPLTSPHWFLFCFWYCIYLICIRVIQPGINEEGTSPPPRPRAHHCHHCEIPSKLSFFFWTLFFSCFPKRHQDKVTLHVKPSRSHGGPSSEEDYLVLWSFVRSWRGGRILLTILNSLIA